MSEGLKELRDALKIILIASEFHSQHGLSDHVMRYAHESTARLAKSALENTRADNTTIIEKLEGMKRRDVYTVYDTVYNQAIQDAIDLIKEQG